MRGALIDDHPTLSSPRPFYFPLTHVAHCTYTRIYTESQSWVHRNQHFRNMWSETLWVTRNSHTKTINSIIFVFTDQELLLMMPFGNIGGSSLTPPPPPVFFLVYRFFFFVYRCIFIFLRESAPSSLKGPGIAHSTVQAVQRTSSTKPISYPGGGGGYCQLLYSMLGRHTESCVHRVARQMIGVYYYNWISLISVMVWTASARYSLIFYFSLLHNIF